MMQGLQRDTANVKGREDLNMAEMDTTYITERIIAVLFPLDSNETAYSASFCDALQMLENRHGDSYTIFNLSERRSDMHLLHKQVLDFGWPDALSPPLERLCNVCKSIDAWLTDSPSNVAVLHCKGGLNRMAVVIAAYIDYSNICAGSDQKLDQLAMRHFYDVKLARFVQPSQRRYIHYFAGLLSGTIKINNSPLFLHKIVIHGIPSFDSQVSCRPFIKIYQGMQPIYVSNVFTPLPGASFICLTLDPCLQLRSDILVKCFNRSGGSPAGREVVFRCQFHTCAVSSNGPLKFRKTDLDEARDDDRFPNHGEVEFVFTSAPERISKPRLASEIGSSLERWNSYENFAADSDEKTSYATHVQTVSTSSSMQGDPKFRLYSSETLANGSFVAIESSSFQSNTVNQLRSASVQNRVTGDSSTSHQVLSKTVNEQEQLDELLRELLGDDVIHQDGTSLAPVSARPALAPGSAPLLQSATTVESDSMQATSLSWQTSHAGLSRSALVAKHTAQPSTRAKVESDAARYRETASDRRPSETESFSVLYERPTHQREATGRIAFDHRRYASDSEDRASWIRERRSGSEDGARRTWKQASEDRAEPKSTQSAYYRSKQISQSDTEDGAAYRRYGPSRQSDDSVASNRQNGSYSFQHNPGSHESTALGSYQYNYETKSYRFPSSCQDGSSLGPGYRQLISGSSGPTSPVIPERGDSSREAVFRSQTGAREWLKSNEVFDTQRDDVSSWRVHESEVEFQHIAPPRGPRPSTPHEPTMSPIGYTTMIPKLVEEEEEQEEEVISLQPIGHGIQSLELRSAKPSLSNFSGNQLKLIGSASLSNMNLVHHHHHQQQQQQQRSPVHDPLKQPGVRHNPLNQFGNAQTLQMGAPSMQQNDSQFFAQRQQNFQTSISQRGAVQSGNHVDQFAQFHQPTRQQNFTFTESSSMSLPSSADVQRKFMYESYLQQRQQQPGTSYNFPAVRQQPYIEMQGDRDQSLVVGVNEGFGENQDVVRSGQYSYKTMQQQQQYLQRHEHTMGSFGGIGLTASREFVPEMQRNPSLSTSVSFDRTQQGSMRRLNSSMQNLLNTESSGSRTLTGDFNSGRTRAASVSKIEERGGRGGGGEGLNPRFLFVCDNSRLWHREHMTREEATAYLLDKPPGWFIVRNSHTYPGAYGLAVKVAQIPPNVIIKRNSQSELVRHFLIEPTPTGVQLKGNPMEPVFGTLAALIYQHTLSPMALPMKLVLPTNNDSTRSNTVYIRCSDSTTRLAGTYAVFSVLYINSIDVDSLSQAIDATFQQSSDPPDAVEVNLKVSNLGITLTDTKHKLFFRRHYPLESLTYCGIDAKDRRWNFTNESGLTISYSGVFGFVARKQGCAVECSCHLFAELDPAHSSTVIAGTIAGMMSGQGAIFPHS